MSGKILQSQDQAVGLANVEIYLNDKLTTKTDKNGDYRLEKLKTGLLKIKAKAGKLQKRLNFYWHEHISHI